MDSQDFTGIIFSRVSHIEQMSSFDYQPGLMAHARASSLSSVAVLHLCCNNLGSTSGVKSTSLHPHQGGVVLNTEKVR